MGTYQESAPPPEIRQIVRQRECAFWSFIAACVLVGTLIVVLMLLE